MSGATADLFGATPTPRLRLTRVETPEDELHAAVAKALTMLVLQPCEWTHFPAGSVPLPPQFAAKLFRFGLKRGWPDFLLLHDRVLFGLELKRVGGQLSKTRLARTRSGAWREVIGQEEMFPRLRTAGMQIAVCRSVPDVLAQLRVWSIPLRRHA